MAWKLRWRGVPCVYTDAEVASIGEMLEKVERGEVSAAAAANEWDVLQELKLRLDATLVDPTPEPPPLDLPADSQHDLFRPEEGIE